MKINSILSGVTLFDKIIIMLSLIFFSVSGIKEKYRYASRLPGLVDSVFYYVLVPIIVLLAFIGTSGIWPAIVIFFILIKVIFFFTFKLVQP